jgi:hypothetical protein
MLGSLLLGGLLLMTESLPAAPFVGPSRDEVVRILQSRNARKRLPIVVGKNEPQAFVAVEGGQWVLRRLESDRKKLDAIERTQLAQGYYVPEHQFGALVPGEVLLSHRVLREFVTQLKAMAWPYGP